MDWTATIGVILIDVSGASLMLQAKVTIEGSTIRAVGRDVAVPVGARVIRAGSGGRILLDSASSRIPVSDDVEKE